MSSLCKPGLLSLPVSEQNSSIATDVKVAPGGTENLDPEIYEAVVCQPIMEPQVSSRNRAALFYTFSYCIIESFFLTSGLDALFLTETWIRPGESLSFAELRPPDCLF